jgi:hypothetical protein
MSYVPVQSIAALEQQGRVIWYVNRVEMTDNQLRTWRKVEVQWPNGNVLHHAIRAVSRRGGVEAEEQLGRPRYENYTVPWVDMLVSIKFHGERVELSLFHNPDLRKLIRAVKWTSSNG